MSQPTLKFHYAHPLEASNWPEVEHWLRCNSTLWREIERRAPDASLLTRLQAFASVSAAEIDDLHSTLQRHIAKHGS